MKKVNSYSFLVVGKTVDSTEVSEFKRYVGLANCKVLAVNPDKAKLDELMGYESQSEPEYVVKDEHDKPVEARIDFIVRTVPSLNNDIEVTQRLRFTLRNEPAYSQDGTSVVVMDDYGDYGRMSKEDADAGNKPVSVNGKDLRVATNYRKAWSGEAALVSFLKTYLGVPSAWNYINGSWVLKEGEALKQGSFKLEEIKKYFSGDFSEIRKAIAMQPNNEVKLLFGVRTVTDEEGNTKHYQSICGKEDFFLRGNASADTIVRLDTRLKNAKASGSFPTTDYKVGELKEWTVEPTSLEKAPEETDSSEDFWS